MPYFHSRVIRHARPDKAPGVSSFSTIAQTKGTEKKPSSARLMVARSPGNRNVFTKSNLFYVLPGLRCLTCSFITQ